jgi:hypothetical protein
LRAKGIEFRGEPEDQGFGIVTTMVLGDVETPASADRFGTVSRSAGTPSTRHPAVACALMDWDPRSLRIVVTGVLILIWLGVFVLAAFSGYAAWSIAISLVFGVLIWWTYRLGTR